jgi:hypothetical protein
MAGARVVRAFLIRDNFHARNLIADRGLKRDFVGKISLAPHPSKDYGTKERSRTCQCEWQIAVKYRLANQISHKSHYSHTKGEDNHRPQNIQFSLEFMIAGDNSVQQMVHDTALFFPRCHARRKRAEVMPGDFLASCPGYSQKLNICCQFH